MDNKVFLLLCLAAVALSLFTHSIVLSKFVMPTYGNTMIHVATARHLVEKGVYPLEDYSYGGGIPNTYVPLYRVAFASLKVLTGLDYDAVGRLLVLVFGAMVPIGFIFAGKELFGDWPGVAAGFLVSTMPEYLIYTVRPLPQAMGLALLPFFILTLAKNRLWPSVFLAAAIALTHQEAGAFLVACAFAFFAFDVIKNLVQNRKIEASSQARTALASWFAGTVAYFAWHFFTIGNLNIFGLAQFVNHEGGVVTLDFLHEKTGLLVPALAVLALLLMAEKTFSSRTRLAGGAAVLGLIVVNHVFGLAKAVSDVAAAYATPLLTAAVFLLLGFCLLVLFVAISRKSSELLILAWLFVGLLAIKNEVFGLSVFMDRFVVYLQVPLVFLAAYALEHAVKRLWHLKVTISLKGEE